MCSVLVMGLKDLLRSLLGRDQSRRPKKKSAAEDAAGSAAAAGPPLSVRLHKAANKAEGFFHASAHPRDVLEHPSFEEIVGILEDPAFSAADLVGYFKGDSPLIQCAAVVALSRRAQLGEQFQNLVGHLSNVALWVLYFALRGFSDLEQPVVGPVLLQAPKWWLKNPLAPEVLSEFVRSRAGREDLSFGVALAAQPAARVRLLQKLLPLLRADTGELASELQRWQPTALDVPYLKSIGRFVENEPKQFLHSAGPVPTRLADLERAVIQDGSSVLLIGESGVGRSQLLRLFLERQPGWRVFETSATDIMAGQKYIGELEGRVVSLVENLRGRRVLWMVPNFQQTLFAGTHEHSSTGIFDMLLPHVRSGAVTIVGEVSPEGFERIVRERPSARSAFALLRLGSYGREESLVMARAWSQHAGSHAGTGPAGDAQPLTARAAADEATRGAAVDEATLQLAAELADQYLALRALPGRLMGLLAAAWRLTGAQAISADDLLTVLSRETGLPISILDDRERLDVESLDATFQRRIVGQRPAIRTVVERLAMIKAGLTDPTRPFGVFLFVGPSGTGKTEIAKTLAEVLFGSSDRLLRFDMSEMQTPESLSRFLGGDAHSDAKSFASQISRQPFSVVLLDEFEKAHPNIWDLFLQVFDDGRLTDRAGNTVDCRHAIIILTSNLGAGNAGGPAIGFGGRASAFSRSAIDKALHQTFRPEFINRLDNVVVFEPFTRAQMRSILNREIRLALDRRGLRRRSWAVEVEDSAYEFLMDEGFSPDMGARPLRRAIEQHLLAPLARTIVTRDFPDGDQFLYVRSEGDHLGIDFVDPDAPADERQGPEDEVSGAGAGSAEPAVAQIVLRSEGTRAELRILENACAKLGADLEDDAWTREKQRLFGRLGEPGFWESPTRFETLDNLEYRDRIEDSLRTARSLLARVQGDAGPVAPKLLRRAAQLLFLLRRAVDGLATGRSQEVELTIRTTKPESEPFARQLRSMYLSWARRRGMRHQVLRDDPGGESGKAFVLRARGFAAEEILRHEAGMHLFEVPGNGSTFERLTAVVSVRPVGTAPVGALSAGAPSDSGPSSDSSGGPAATSTEEQGAPPVVRRYRALPSPLVRDAVRGWRTGKLDAVLSGDFDLF